MGPNYHHDSHYSCIYNCGATDCIAPEMPQIIIDDWQPDRTKQKAIEKIKKQPFYKEETKHKAEVVR